MLTGGRKANSISRHTSIKPERVMLSTKDECNGVKGLQLESISLRGTGDIFFLRTYMSRTNRNVKFAIKTSNGKVTLLPISLAHVNNVSRKHLHLFDSYPKKLFTICKVICP